MSGEKSSLKYFGYITAIITIISSVYAVGYWHRGVKNDVLISKLQERLSVCQKNSNCDDELEACNKECGKKIKINSLKYKIDFNRKMIRDKNDKLIKLNIECEKCKAKNTCIYSKSCEDAKEIEHKILILRDEYKAMKEDLLQYY